MGMGIIARGILLGALALGVIAGAVALWVFVYSVGVDPGHDPRSYQLYGQRIAPMFGILLGIPLMIAAGWLSARGTTGMLAPLLPVIFYVLLDIALCAAGNLWPPAWSLIVSWLTKLGAAWVGGTLARQAALRRGRAG